MPVICIPDELAAALDREALPGVEPIVWDGSGAVPAAAADVTFWVPTYMGKDTALRDAAIAAMPRLEVIQVLSAGVEAWRGAVPDGVTLCNGRGIHGVSTAELALAGILALLRDVPAFLGAQQRGQWSPRETESLAGKRVLIVGAGDIGAHVAAAVRVFGAEVSFVARTGRDGVHAIEELPGLLPGHDIVVLALPLTEQSRGLVDAEFLAALPDGAIVVNVARGGIVVTDALVAELTAGRLRAALDVTDPEPLPAGHPLWTAPNLVLTPHVGGGTPGWQVRASRLVRDQLGRFLAGQPLQNVVRDGY